MEYRRFGRTDLQVSAIALGSGGPNRFGQRVGIPEAHIHRLVRHALELGINLFDTSPGYSDSELILGRALAGVARDRYHLSTKVVIDDAVTGEHPAPVQQVVASVEASLRRLRVDHVDVLLLAGWPQPGAYRRIIEETIPALRGGCRSRASSVSCLRARCPPTMEPTPTSRVGSVTTCSIR